MNRGALQSLPVQQMMAGNPNWWNINSMRPPTQQPSPFFSSATSTFCPSSSSILIHSWHDNQDLPPESWSQLLMGGLVPEGDKLSMNSYQAGKKLENWEEQVLQQTSNASAVDVKQENSSGSYGYGHANEEFQAAKSGWSHLMPASSTKSSITTFGSSMLDFSSNKADVRHPPTDRSSECNSTACGGAAKKARVQASSPSTFKVRKEKLGDRITALHQLVSPFGKTDTASVLLEAIGYIRFLQSQIEALSLPFLGCGSAKLRQQQSVQGERNSIFPEDPGQLLNDNCMKRKGVSEQESSQEEPKRDLRSRGLCLVPVSCTMHVGSDNGADFWAPALGGGFR